MHSSILTYTHIQKNMMNIKSNDIGMKMRRRIKNKDEKRACCGFGNAYHV